MKTLAQVGIVAIAVVATFIYREPLADAIWQAAQAFGAWVADVLLAPLTD